jgi:hypothetical protein
MCLKTDEKANAKAVRLNSLLHKMRFDRSFSQHRHCYPLALYSFTAILRCSIMEPIKFRALTELKLAIKRETGPVVNRAALAYYIAIAFPDFLEYPDIAISLSTVDRETTVLIGVAVRLQLRHGSAMAVGDLRTSAIKEAEENLERLCAELD